jgi:hypothetical protein
VKERRVTVLISTNFERNLVEIEKFLSDGDARQAFDALIEHLSTDVVPTLERFPEIGADFMAKAPLSVEGRVLFERIAAMAGPDAELRQLIDSDYVILYLLRSGSLILLSIRHHRQLSFDFSGNWP